MHRAIDDYYLALTLIITVCLQLTCFLIAYTLSFDKITDFSASVNFLLLTLLTFGLGEFYYARQIIVLIFIILWSVRLGSFLLYRVLLRGKDARFDEMREKFLSFLGFWIFQMIWVWVVSLPVTMLNSAPINPSIGARDVIGWILFAIGLLTESAADFSKQAFSQRPENKGKIIMTNVWRYSRHPNYFGECLVWLGIFLTSSSVYEPNDRAGAYAAVLSPILTFVLLMFLSGAPIGEQRYNERFGRHSADYMKYRQETSILIPMPPAVYKRIPLLVKRVLLLELPLYERGLDKPVDANADAASTAAPYRDLAAHSSQQSRQDLHLTDDEQAAGHHT